MAELKVRGNANRQDSFVACICGVLNAWGRKVSYGRVAGLSGMAFSPVYDEREDCRAWWMEGGDDIRVGFLGEALGFSVEEVVREWTHEDEAWNVNPNVKKIPRKTSEYFDKLRVAVQEGKSVLVDTWPTWGILTAWKKDVTQLSFETFPDFSSLVQRAWPPHKTGKAYALSPIKPLLGKREADMKALSFAVKIASGKFDLERQHYGGLFYKSVAKRLVHEPFCVPCGSEAHRCGARTVNRTIGVAKSATQYLNMIGAEKVKTRYQEICDILKEYQDSKCLKDSWQDRIFRFEMRDAFLKAYLIHKEAANELENYACW